MAQKFKANTRIPMIPTPKIISQNLNSKENSNIRNIKPMFSRAPHLRRSKSLSDFNSINCKSNVDIKQSSLASIVKKPLKRPAVVDSNPILKKVSKVDTKSEPAKSKPIQPKFAPYDYKGRFNHLKEIHEKLKETHRDLKEQHVTIADQNEDLLAKTTQLQNDFDNIKNDHAKLRKAYDDLKHQHSTASERIENLETKSNNLELELNEKRKLLESTSKELEEIRIFYNKVTLKFESTQTQLGETLKDNTFMKEELRFLQDEKRRMHNTIQELKGNIRVFCRLRPPISSEEDKLLYNINYVDETTMEIYKSKDKKLEFSFDKIFSSNCSQAEVFEELSQLVQSALDGYNVCVFAYGQTGSGKTYTMEGEPNKESIGMIPRAIDTIFHTLNNMKRLGWVYHIKASFLEIYNENIVDLLDPKKSNLEIRMCDAKGTDVYVSNLTIEEIHSAEKLKSYMKIAQRNRAVAATENNERSSRSHSVTKIMLEGVNEQQGQTCIGNLNLIDLAGSEKFHTNETTRLRETTNINKSLSTLNNVILSLVKKNSHIPYRNSKLTHLLMPSLGGNSKTLMLVNISPLDECYNESVNSLRFASTVNQCKTGTIKKQKTIHSS